MSHHLYPGLTSKQTVLLIKVHLQPPDSSNGPSRLPALSEIHPKKRANSEKNNKKRGHHKLFSKLPSWPNATCLPIVWGLPLLRGEKNILASSVSNATDSSVSASNGTVSLCPPFSAFCSLSQQHLTALCMDLYYRAFYLIFTLFFYLPPLWDDECLDCKDSTVFLCSSVPTVKGMALAKGWVFVK